MNIGRQGLYFRPGNTVNSAGIKSLVSMLLEIQDVLDRARNFGTVKGLTVIQGLDGRQYAYSGAHTAWRRASARRRERCRFVQIFGRERSGREAIVVAQHTAEPLAFLDDPVGGELEQPRRLLI